MRLDALQGAYYLLVILAKLRRQVQGVHLVGGLQLLENALREIGMHGWRFNGFNSRVNSILRRNAKSESRVATTQPIGVYRTSISTVRAKNQCWQPLKGG